MKRLVVIPAVSRFGARCGRKFDRIAREGIIAWRNTFLATFDAAASP